MKKLNTALGAFALAALAASGSALAGDATASAAAKAQYDQERARCMSGSTGQTQDTCLRSAGAAYAEAKQGRLENPSTTYRQNALARCKGLPAADQADCALRVDQGTPRSDVTRGGDLKETVTTTVATPAAK